MADSLFLTSKFHVRLTKMADDLFSYSWRILAFHRSGPERYDPTIRFTLQLHVRRLLLLCRAAAAATAGLKAHLD